MQDCWPSKFVDDVLLFQVGRFGFCLTFLKDVVTAQAARKYLPSGPRASTCRRRTESRFPITRFSGIVNEVKTLN